MSSKIYDWNLLISKYDCLPFPHCRSEYERHLPSCKLSLAVEEVQIKPRRIMSEFVGTLSGMCLLNATRRQPRMFQFRLLSKIEHNSVICW